MNKEKVLSKTKEILNHVFIDGLTGMAWGLFSTLIIGLIICQIGSFIPGNIGKLIVIIGTIAKGFTGAGIGIGVAVKFKSSPFVTASAAIAGTIGAFATQIIAGTIISGKRIIVNRSWRTIRSIFSSSCWNRDWKILNTEKQKLI